MLMGAQNVYKKGLHGQPHGMHGHMLGECVREQVVHTGGHRCVQEWAVQSASPHACSHACSRRESVIRKESACVNVGEHGCVHRIMWRCKGVGCAIRLVSHALTLAAVTTDLGKHGVCENGLHNLHMSRRCILHDMHLMPQRSLIPCLRNLTIM